MNSPAAPWGPSKYAWRAFEPHDLPKREVGERVGDCREVHLAFDEEEAREQAARCVQCPNPGCVDQCPLGSHIQEWMLLAAEGRFLEAAAVIRQSDPIPEICARICPKDHLCESGCILDGPSLPVSIGALEQFLEEYALAHEDPLPPPIPANGRRVAVVGAGPAGLACADELSRRGYAVTVFDPEPEPGGVLVGGTAPFRLDPAVVRRRVGILERRGVAIRTGRRPGIEVALAELRSGFDAVFVGLDARRPHPLEIPGGELVGVETGPEFLAHTRDPLMAAALKGRRVVVVGDDDLAVDCARAAVRGGAVEVVCACPHREAALLCARRDHDDAVEEGVRFVLGVEVGEVLSEGEARTLARVRLTRIEASAETGEAAGAVPGGEEVRADRLVVCLGFDPAPAMLPGDFAALDPEGKGQVPVDERLMTPVPGVFAGGDVVRGPCLVVHAIRDARRAVDGIEAYLGMAAAAPR